MKKYIALALVLMPAAALAAPSPYAKGGPPKDGPYRFMCPDSEIDFIIRYLPNGNPHPNQNPTGKCDEFNV